MVRKMEKINKEELMKKLNLTEEDLEKVAGGSDFECEGNCWYVKSLIDLSCRKYDKDPTIFKKCGESAE